MKKKSKIIVSRYTISGLKSLRNKLKKTSYGSTVQWLLSNHLDVETIRHLEEIRVDNNYNTLTEVIENLIQELDECQSKNEK